MLKSFCRLTGQRLRPLPINNASQYAAPLAEYFTPSSCDILADHYADDFKRFRYYHPDPEDASCAQLHGRQWQDVAD